nr:MAG TPA: hypothetical protein [Caudoviricetes sp.]
MSNTISDFFDNLICTCHNRSSLFLFNFIEFFLYSKIQDSNLINVQYNLS